MRTKNDSASFSCPSVSLFLCLSLLLRSSSSTYCAQNMYECVSSLSPSWLFHAFFLFSASPSATGAGGTAKRRGRKRRTELAAPEPTEGGMHERHPLEPSFVHKEWVSLMWPTIYYVVRIPSRPSSFCSFCPSFLRLPFFPLPFLSLPSFCLILF